MIAAIREQRSDLIEKRDEIIELEKGDDIRDMGEREKREVLRETREGIIYKRQERTYKRHKGESRTDNTEDGRYH